MVAKPVWHNDIERDAFIETNCLRCFQPDQAKARVMGSGPGCPHLARAEQNKMPRVWTKRRNAVIGETYKCDDKLDKPPVNRRGNAPADTPPMFDAGPEDVDFVPVEGWPTAVAFGKKAKSKEGDHQ